MNERSIAIIGAGVQAGRYEFIGNSPGVAPLYYSSFGDYFPYDDKEKETIAINQQELL